MQHLILRHLHNLTQHCRGEFLSELLCLLLDFRRLVESPAASGHGSVGCSSSPSPQSSDATGSAANLAPPNLLTPEVQDTFCPGCFELLRLLFLRRFFFLSNPISSSLNVETSVSNVCFPRKAVAPGGGPNARSRPSDGTNAPPAPASAPGTPDVVVSQERRREE